jgi:peptidoglycan-N-acetylglucosamine deacetylase
MRCFMIGDELVGVGIRTVLCSALALMLSTSVVTPAVAAADCPGHPDALGTSRTLVVDPREHPRIGTMQYPETLPLEDHEVVLTFDDGPLPRNSNQILAILADQCIKATFFEIGRMAQFAPEGVRKLRDAGHSIGTHSQTHPLTMNKMPIERAKQEIDDGIASVKAALGDDGTLAPFFRIPGLLRAEGVEQYLASQGIQTWSADFPADDWRHISSSRVYDLAIKRLEEKGRGILLLHDIQARTVAALPRILAELKARGYRIVHVVPATAERPATPTEPQQWQLHPPTENVAISHWPKIPGFAFATAETLPVPSLSDFDWLNGQPIAYAEPFGGAGRKARGAPPVQEPPWPQTSALPVENAAVALPVPSPGIFDIPEKSLAVIAPGSPRAKQPAHDAKTGEHAKVASVDEEEERPTRGKRHAGRHGRVHVAGRRGGKPAAHARRGPLKHMAQVKKRRV